MHDKFKQLTDAGVPIRDGKKPSRVWQSREFEKLANAKLDIERVSHAQNANWAFSHGIPFVASLGVESR